MPQFTTPTLPVAYPGTPQLQIDSTGMDTLSIAVAFRAGAGATNGKARIKIEMYSKTVTAGAIVHVSHGQEVELQDDLAGLITKENFLEYETDTANDTAITITHALWDERIASTYDRIDVSAYEAGDAANPGVLVLTYAGAQIG
jgi:hypothetical protein